MTNKEINLIAVALRNTRGLFPLRDELNMWECCVSEMIIALEHLPNFDRVAFQIAVGSRPIICVKD